MSDMSARLVAHIGQQVARAEAAEAEVAERNRRIEAALAVCDGRTFASDESEEGLSYRLGREVLAKRVREALRGES